MIIVCKEYFGFFKFKNFIFLNGKMFLLCSKIGNLYYYIVIDYNCKSKN